MIDSLKNASFLHLSKCSAECRNSDWCKPAGLCSSQNRNLHLGDKLQILAGVLAAPGFTQILQRELEVDLPRHIH
jgi:hypothetical protein